MWAILRDLSIGGLTTIGSAVLGLLTLVLAYRSHRVSVATQKEDAHRDHIQGTKADIRKDLDRMAELILTLAQDATSFFNSLSKPTKDYPARLDEYSANNALTRITDIHGPGFAELMEVYERYTDFISDEVLENETELVCAFIQMESLVNISCWAYSDDEADRAGEVEERLETYEMARDLVEREIPFRAGLIAERLKTRTVYDEHIVAVLDANAPVRELEEWEVVRIFGGARNVSLASGNPRFPFRSRIS